MPLPPAALLRCQPLPLVRIGLVGLGRRGLKTLERSRYLRHAAITALADLDADKCESAQEELMRTERPKARTYVGTAAWKELCSDASVDLVYVCTDWDSHADIAQEAMLRGKHVAIEVPAATTVADCWRLVDTAERTQRHCFMTENCCYDRFSLATIEMHQKGLFGELTHFEGAYIHRIDEGSPWMLNHYAHHGGNPYPTHGLGPIGWLANLHRGDRMDYLVSVTTANGNINNTLIRTILGRTILLQLDVTTRRPYSRLQTVCGTRGFVRKYPQPVVSFPEHDNLQGDAAWHVAEQYLTADPAQRWHHGHDMGVPNEMNYAMDSRLIHCLVRGLPLDIDVYDAAEWSCIAELSQESAQNGSQPVRIPDFTRGHWADTPAHCFY
ncbi:MAG: Gfo/Idh/MocA family oxidoreductase [Alloprevotella sp.]|nr:Gfo/Idh/MocA family oxidoreductase [Alloprevotella sp.]